MAKKYFRKKNPDCRTEEIKWIEMSGKGYYQFVCDPANKNRFFINMGMGDAMLETTKAQQCEHKSGVDHSDYLAEQERGWSAVSIYSIGVENASSGEEIIADKTQSVERAALERLRRQEVRMALRHLPAEEYRLIDALYLSEPRKTLRQLSAESGVAVHLIFAPERNTEVRAIVEDIFKSSYLQRHSA